MKKLLTLILLACSLCVCAEEHFLVGGCTPSGWSNGLWERSQVQMVKVANTSEWICCLHLKTGNGDNGRFKIPNSANGMDGYWAPEQNTVLTSEWSDISTDGENDYKWCVAEQGIYLVTIDTENLKIKAEKLTAPEKDGDFYLVGSLADYYYVAGAITSGEQYGKIRLTADLDFQNKPFFPFSADRLKFKGEIDGAGHIIDHVVFKDDGDNIGFVRWASDGANIHDLIMGENCYFEGNAKISGLVGFAHDGGTVTITNVINKATVHSKGSNDANAAGFVACSLDGTKVALTNCANMGRVSGQDGQCAAFLGWAQHGSTLTRCWNRGDINNMDGQAQLYRSPNLDDVTATNCYDVTDKGNQGTRKDVSTIASGELCYLLNGDQSVIGWYQTIGTDDIPVPFNTHSQVYANGKLKCDGSSAGGELTYSNTETSEIPPHTYSDGYCTGCNLWLEEGIIPVDGWYEIGTEKALRWAVEAVNEHNSTYGNKNYRLTADIDYSAYTDQAAMFGGPYNIFSGVFDGQCHTVEVAFNNTSAEETALFRRVKGATVKNLKVTGTITTDKKYAGGIVSGVWGNAIIQNCEAAVVITDEEGGDGTHGGILARISDKVYNNVGIQILNCLFSGEMNCPNREGSCAIVGWSDNGYTDVKIKNCLVTGSVNLKDSDCDLISRSGATVENCYYTCALQNNLKNGKNAKAATAEQATSGELAFLLGNENWFQNLPNDEAPVPFSTHYTVYQNGNFLCDHKTSKGSTSYSNVEGAAYDDHVFGEYNLCTGCKAVGQIGEKVEGKYQITNIGNLIRFSELVNNGEADAEAVVTADIEQGDAVYTPIGNSEHPYRGKFGGGFHTITLALDNPTLSNQGIFGVLTDGAEIHNITSAGSIKGLSCVGGIAGSTSGNGGVRFFNCGNEAMVEATNANAGGILGVNTGSEAYINMTNCYNAGDIKGAQDNGGLSGWVGRSYAIINCYNIGSVENGALLFRTDVFGCVNTYGYNKIPDEMIASGELCYQLGDKNFRQEIGVDAHPVLSDTKPNVFFNGTYVNVTENVTLDETKSFRTKLDFDANVTINRTMNADKWNTFCVPVDMEIPAGWEVKELTGAIINNENATMEFATAESIVAGKPYMVRPSENVTTIDVGSTTVKSTLTPSESNGVIFTGVYESGKAPEGSFIISNNNFYEVNSGITLKAFRGYITVEGGYQVKALKSPFEDDGYTGVLVDNGTQKTCYLFSEQPTVKYQEVEGVMNACLFAEGGETPVVSVPLTGGAKLSVSYDAFERVNLNSEGYATFSAKDASFIATEGVTAYKAAVDGELITLTALEGNIPAGTGVLLYGETPNAKVNLPVATSGSDADVTGNSLQPTTLADGSLAEMGANVWALGGGNQFLRYTGSAFIHNRAYLVHEQQGGAKSMQMIFADDETSGLDKVVSKESTRDGKFLENGNIVIIKNGKKYNVAGQTIK